LVRPANSVNPSLSFSLVVILSIIWGLAFVAIRRAEFELTPENLTLLRWIIASGTFLILAPFIGKPNKPIQKNHVPRILLVSFASVLGYHLTLNYAETMVSAGLAGLLIAFGPIFIALLSTIFLKEKVGSVLILALVLALVGTLIPSIGAGLTFRQVAGPIAVIVAAFMYSVYSVGSKPLVKEYGALPTAVWLAVIGTIFTLPLFSFNFIAQISSLSPFGWLSVLYLAILSTVIANMILYTLIGDRAVSKLSVQLYLVPLVSLIGGIILLGESLSILIIIGAGLLFSATALATHKH